MKTSTVTNSNQATATRLAQSIERALQTEHGEVEVIPGVPLPVADAMQFIELAKEDPDKASDGDLAFNLQYYVISTVQGRLSACA